MPSNKRIKLTARWPGRRAAAYPRRSADNSGNHGVDSTDGKL
jgi:hypothetical protein